MVVGYIFMHARPEKMLLHASSGSMFPQVASQGDGVSQGKYYISGCFWNHYQLADLDWR